jgi:hypothetical protein
MEADVSEAKHAEQPLSVSRRLTQAAAAPMLLLGALR